ncbi:winged helix-turn-helix domain-containing protein [Salmonirosea aquatica]|uniref:winged helix-turn-helix domain-containing protein n=1 Tax=Salmonirosea aquatica TaxID=2654236 RepID=UPI003570F1C7
MRAKYKPSDYEAFRKRCVEMKEAGWRQKDISAALGLTEGWVSQTLKKYRDSGAQGLLARKATGAPPRMTSDQLEKLVEELKRGAQHHGFSGEIWTRQRVNALIERLFGVSYDPTQVGRILKSWDGSLQKPAKKARQQSTQKVNQWREEVLPGLKKS